MSDFQFDEPVVLKTGGHVLEIRDAVQAARTLSDGWPETRGKWYHAASRACKSAMKGETAPIRAQLMFKQAVEESRLSA